MHYSNYFLTGNTYILGKEIMIIVRCDSSAKANDYDKGNNNLKQK